MSIHSTPWVVASSSCLALPRTPSRPPWICEGGGGMRGERGDERATSRLVRAPTHSGRPAGHSRPRSRVYTANISPGLEKRPAGSPEPTATRGSTRREPSPVRPPAPAKKISGPPFPRAPAPHLGVQRLHAPVHDLWGSGVLADIGDGEARVAERLGGASRGEDLDARRGKGLAEGDEPGLVRHGQEGGARLDEVGSRALHGGDGVRHGISDRLCCVVGAR
jgi:hypothetical protein